MRCKIGDKVDTQTLSISEVAMAFAGKQLKDIFKLLLRWNAFRDFQIREISIFINVYFPIIMSCIDDLANCAQFSKHGKSILKHACCSMKWFTRIEQQILKRHGMRE